MIGAALAAPTSGFRKLKLLLQFFFTFNVVVEHYGKKLLILLVKLLCARFWTRCPLVAVIFSVVGHLLSTFATFVLFGVTFLHGEAAVRSCPS